MILTKITDTNETWRWSTTDSRQWANKMVKEML